jgi:hypothetical protein
MSRSTLSTCLTTTAVCALVAACGGGGSDASSDVTAAPPSPTANQQRIDAATAAAQSSVNACASIRPFYWEIGDRSSAMASGSVSSAASTTVYTQASLMSIASASKWLYATYVVEKRAGVLTADDYRYLNFESGYTSFATCDQGQTVAECDAMGTNGDYTAADDGKFFYNGGHMEKHATLFGLGAMNNAALATEIKSQLGSTGTLIYTQPQLAGGVFTSSAVYACRAAQDARRRVADGSGAGIASGLHEPENVRDCGERADPGQRELALLDRALGRGRSEGGRRSVQQCRAVRLLSLDRFVQDLLRDRRPCRQRRRPRFCRLRAHHPQGVADRHRPVTVSATANTRAG